MRLQFTFNVLLSLSSKFPFFSIFVCTSNWHSFFQMHTNIGPFFMFFPLFFFFFFVSCFSFFLFAYIFFQWIGIHFFSSRLLSHTFVQIPCISLIGIVNKLQSSVCLHCSSIYRNKKGEHDDGILKSSAHSQYLNIGRKVCRNA